MILRFLLSTCLCFVLAVNSATAKPNQTTTAPSATEQPRRSFRQWLISLFHREIKKNQWDVLAFAQAYPVPYCALKHDNWCQTYLNQSEWIVRGIWPTRKDGHRTSECEKTQFNTTSLKPILPQMKQHWTSILHADEEFWEHEWVKHGSCSLEIFKTELDYFKQGLEWNKKWQLADILRAKKILPSNEKTYKYSDFYDTIRTAVGSTPHLKCHSYKNISFIKEVRLCISKKLKLLDCDRNYKQLTDCPKEGIIYPRTPDFYKKLHVFTNKIGQPGQNTTDVSDLEE